MALGFSRVRVKTAERELPEMAKKLKVAETEKLQWRKWGEEAEAKLRVRGEKVVGQVALLEEQLGYWKGRSSTAKAQEKVWKGKAQETEEKLRIRVQEAGEQEKEEEARMVGVVAAGEADARSKCDYDWKLRNYKTLVAQAEDRTRHAKEREAGATAGLSRSDSEK